MSTFEELKAAAVELSVEDRYELLHWLAGSEEMRRRDLEELRHAVAVGVEQADRGELSSMDIESMERGRPRPQPHPFAEGGRGRRRPRSNHRVSTSTPSESA